MSAFNGPGKYDAECSAARESAAAKGAVLMIYEGHLGMGFEVQGPLEMLAGLPVLLREMADHIEGELRRSGVIP